MTGGISSSIDLIGNISQSDSAGAATFIEFHLVVPGALSVSQAHDLCDRVESGLKNLVQGCVVTIHVEPEFKAKHSGIVVL